MWNEFGNWYSKKNVLYPQLSMYYKFIAALSINVGVTVAALKILIA